MKIKYKTVMNDLPKITKRLETLNSKTVEVGCIKGDHAWLAGIHEYGLDIEVTPKMRAFLHSQGLHLSPNTTHIKIPERSFLRTGHDTHIDEVMNKADKLVGLVVSGQMSEDQLLDFIGLTLATKIKTYARDLSNPPNHPYTIEQKGSSNPLVATGNMIEGISFEVK